MRSFVICTPAQIRILIKSRGMRWVRHVAALGENRKCITIFVKTDKKDHWEDIDGRQH
jgi:hypothetical protein